MSADQSTPSDPQGQAGRPDTVGPMLTGIIECLFAFGVMLDKRGLVTRAELGDEFGRLVQQLKQRSSSLAASQLEFDARSMPAVALRDMFKIPASSGPIVVQGGKDPEPPEPAG